jgi:hypothetical protein
MKWAFRAFFFQHPFHHEKLIFTLPHHNPQDAFDILSCYLYLPDMKERG